MGEDMNRHRLWCKGMAFLSLLILFSVIDGCSDDSSSSSKSDTESLRIYEMIAGSGIFTPVADDTTGNSFKLSLGDVPEEILYFTDSPAQEAGFDSTDNVMNHIWPRVYGEVAPNALMKATMASQESIELFCVLDKPLYNATQAELSFTLTFLVGSQDLYSQLTVTDVKLIILNNAATDQNEWSQILTGHIGTFEPTATKGTYTFWLGSDIGSVFSYTSAPMRLLATLTAQDYIQGWLERFGDTPPNASIAYDPDEGQAGGVQIVTLSNPEYDEETGSVRFTAKALYGLPPIEEGGLTVGNPTLFVDGGNPDFEYCSGDDAAWCSPCWNAPDNTWCCKAQGSGSPDCGIDASTCVYTPCHKGQSCDNICIKPPKGSGPPTNIKITNSTSEDITIAFVTAAVGGACNQPDQFIDYLWVAKNTTWCQNPTQIGGDGAGYCTGVVPANGSVEVTRTGDDGKKCLSGAIQVGGHLSCPPPTGFSQGEFTLNPTDSYTEAVDISLVNGVNHALTIHLPGNAWAVQDGGEKVTSVGPNEGLHGDNNKNGIFPPGCTDCIQAVEGKIPCPDITPNPQCQQTRICNIYRGGVTGGTVEFVIGEKLN
jgi:hypothetical protein